jgi:hypothetical protein
MADAQSSTPSFSDFYPHIPYQADVMNAINCEFDYSLGVHEVLLSGSVGSAKSILLAHMSMYDLLAYPRGVCLIGRQSMPDLRDTIYTKILEHIEGTVKTDGSLFREGRDFGFTDNNCEIWFRNGSRYISRSWHDRKFKKLGSLELSIAIIEELTENGIDHWPAYLFVKTRVGRLRHVPRSWIMAATNPDAPSHPAYEYFQIGERMAGRTEGVNRKRHVWFSSTEDNIFLPKTYTEGLLETLDKKMAQRLVYGLWVEIKTGVIYYAYGPKNFRETKYEIDEGLPIHVSFDFNIGAGKPMSACYSQVRGIGSDLTFHFFGEAVVEGADTEDLLEEIAGQGLFENQNFFVINGDATGGSRTTKSKKTDYDIIREFLSRFRRKDGSRLEFDISVPKANPPIRTRHNLVNGYCRNALGKTRLFVYKPCKMLDKGLRLVAPKEGGQYVEDDRHDYQHITTSAGYHICRVHSFIRSSNAGMRQVQFR